MDLLLAGVIGAMIGATVATFVVAFLGAGRKPVPKVYALQEDWPGQTWFNAGVAVGRNHPRLPADEEGERLAQRFYEAVQKVD